LSTTRSTRETLHWCSMDTEAATAVDDTGGRRRHRLHIARRSASGGHRAALL